jgi:predicted permease
MKKNSPVPKPPRLAEALLTPLLPSGVLGLSILGDLRQEYRDVVGSGISRFPRIWYWRTAIALGGRYSVFRLKRLPRVVRFPRFRDIIMQTAILGDIRHGVRMLIKTPSVSLIAILTVGLGVAVCTQSFSSVFGSIMIGLPVPDADRLMYINANRPDLGAEDWDVSPHDYLDLRELLTSFEDLAAVYRGTANLAGEEGPPERFAGAFVSANALGHLQVPPILGRTFLPDEDAPGASPVAVLAYHVWQNRFAGDTSTIGRVIRVNGEATEVVGIMPEGFAFPFNEDIWLPNRIDVSSLARGSGRPLLLFGRLREGVYVGAARAELSALAGELGRRFPDSNQNLEFGMKRYDFRFMPTEIHAVMWVMLASSFGVLLIACTNVANLLLARAASRSKEVAVRTALGASRFRVIRQLMVESAMLAFLGGIIGVAIAAWGVEVIDRIQASVEKPYWIDMGVGLPVVFFAFAATIAASIAAGMLPAFRASGVEIGEVLKDETRGSSGLRLGLTSNALVVAEIAVSCALLIGAGFLIKSVIKLRNVDLGFEPGGVLTGRVGLFEADYPDAQSRDLFLNLLKERLEQEPGITSATLGTHLPALGSYLEPVGVEGESYATERDYPSAYLSSISPDYFRTFGVALLEGRDFDALEARVGGDPVTIVSQSFVDRFLPDRDVLGRRIRWGISTPREQWLTIVGVVPDMYVGGGVGGIGDDRKSPERFYVPNGLGDYRFHALAVRTAGPPEPMATRVREIVADLDSNLPVYAVATLEDAIQQATWAFAMFGRLFTVFGAAALFLAAVGLYGVLAFSVSQRRLEMGIRMALGAERGSIVRLVMKKGAVQLCIGILGGLGIGALMGGPMRFVLYGVEKGDPTVYAGVVVTLLAAGLLACFVPARAATKTDPVEAMREA